MKLEKAVELLRDETFDMEEDFWSELGEDVTAEYPVIVSDPTTLLDDIDINLDEVTDESDLLFKVEKGLYSIMDSGSDGVNPYYGL